MKRLPLLFLILLVFGGCSATSNDILDERTLEVMEMVQPLERAVVPVKGDAAKYVKILESNTTVIEVDDTYVILGGNSATVRAKDNSVVHYVIYGDKIHKIAKSSDGNVTEDTWFESNESDFKRLGALFRKLPKTESGSTEYAFQEQGADHWGLSGYNVFDAREAITLVKQEHPEFPSTPNVTITKILPTGGMWGSTRDVKFTTSVEQIGKTSFNVTFIKDWDLNICGTDVVCYWKYTVTPQGYELREYADNEAIVSYMR